MTEFDKWYREVGRKKYRLTYKFELREIWEAAAAAEREACAELCESQAQQYEEYTGRPTSLAYQCAAAIRARGEVK